LEARPNFFRRQWPGHFGLYTLKALAFIHLRRDENAMSQRYLDKIAELGAMETVGEPSSPLCGGVA